MSRSARAIGKFLLAGEHSVLYEGPAISLPLFELTLRYKEEKGSGVILNNEELAEEASNLVYKLRQNLFGKIENKKVVMDSSIPIGSGLGSSAALCCAMLRYHKKQENLDLAREALKGETLFHGNPSGVDPFTVAFEKGLAFWKTGAKFEKLDLSRFKESALKFVLVDTGKSHQTSQVIACVEGWKQRDPIRFEELIKELASLSMDSRQFLENSPEKLIETVHAIHDRLQALGLSNDLIEDVRNQVLKHGAVAAKITGAGAGGFVLALMPKENHVPKDFPYRCIYPQL